ncbi:bifunctional 5,10-methylenetetrahydrofolate dehydrogenase/5,10-methenyltetrahydrofolate cyclohydrolase [Actinoplanes sp. LDG1-06]|uniref:Bifunctional protein FolD n=1 Tax=Paractinoplanes ovalisporus TaxID=2810368 RepID=A0ABS2AEX4_9ACTN|nr:tetrahydrofolate dehydrogenase/cyclohydrolase catalytic domain-containing protein [Actinoplanes ovalisporus]MBM2617794.1 bifunctional 5,10-methylenetetrahydrofolate dehydrogenase/5,10-methenyltetrahydrofolate cyclohydrolase [Actinoplanes ovalisporus]
MSARLLPGKPVAEAVLADVAERAAKLTAQGVTPSLATVLVGDDDASAGYIRIKQRQAAELGFDSPHRHLSGDITQEHLLAVIAELNADTSVHGVLIQYPIPAHLDYDAALMTLDPDKDVDGMHPLNMGRLAVGLPGPLPCTPAGIEALLAHYEIPVAGREVVILGRGATLGRPLAMLLAQKRPTANAAVTVVHTGVPDWERYTKRAEILIAAAGVPGIIQPGHVRPGATVVGAGVRYEGKRLLPDVAEECAEVAGAITPRVGGVGPTTVAMLFRNAITAAEKAVATAG